MFNAASPALRQSVSFVMLIRPAMLWVEKASTWSGVVSAFGKSSCIKGCNNEPCRSDIRMLTVLVH
jgi:hypothetical protein